MKPIVPILIFFIVYPILDAYRDTSVRKNYGQVNHLVNSISYGLICLVIAYYSFFDLPLLSVVDLKWELMEIVFIGLAFRWILFDGFYNLFMGVEWDYIGNTSWMDKHIKRGLRIVLKSLFGTLAIAFTLQYFIR